MLIGWIHLAVLWAFSFAKPLFDVLADSPDFFVARGNTAGDILLFSIAMVVVPPTLLALVEAAFSKWPPVRQGLHLLFLAVLAGAFAVQVLDDAVGGSAAVLLVLGAAAGVLGALAYSRWQGVRTALTVLAPLPVLFLLLFLFSSGVSKLVLPQDDASAATGDLRADTPVVVLVLDELDPNMLMGADGRIDATRYPNFAALARRATWYRNATTVNSQTTVAVPALLSGQRPPRDRLPIAADYPGSLFTLLGDDYSLNVNETATELCAESLCGERRRTPFRSRARALAKDLGVVSLHLLLPEGARGGLPAVDQTFGGFTEGGRDEGSAPAANAPVSEVAFRNRRQTFDDLLDGMRAGQERPGLHFLHLALPHIPWQYLPDGRQYAISGPDIPGLANEQWSTAPGPARIGLQRHLLQLGYVDQLVGRLMARLRRTGLFDRSLLVITGDHGVSFRPGDSRRAPTETNFSDIAAVPLLIKYPNERQGRVDDSMVRTIDILPTIAAALGTKLPWKADGQDVENGGPAAGEVTVAAGRSEASITKDFADFVRRREAGLRRMIALFGSGDGARVLYASGPDADMLGRQAGSLEGRSPTAGRVALDSRELLDPAGGDATTTPSFITGRLEEGVSAGTRLAVSLNGTIRAVTTAFPDGEEVRMAAMVPASSVASGPNDLGIFTITGRGKARRLVRLQTEQPATYRIVERDGSAALTGTGSDIPIEDGRIEGFVDYLERDDRDLRVGGWAIDRAAERPASLILVFHEDRLVAQEAPEQIRPDMVESFKTFAVAKSGFDLRVNVSDVDLDEIRVFAIREGSASELPRYTG